MRRRRNAASAHRAPRALTDFVKNSSLGHRTSMLVEPGRRPAAAADAAGRGAVQGRPLELGPRTGLRLGRPTSTAGTAASRRGFPASMFPFRYNNGIRIFQSPGYVVIHARDARHPGDPDRTRRRAQHWPRAGRSVDGQQPSATGKATRWSSRRPTSRRRQRHARHAYAAPRRRSTWPRRACRRSTPSRPARRPR